MAPFGKISMSPIASQVFFYHVLMASQVNAKNI